MTRAIKAARFAWLVASLPACTHSQSERAGFPEAEFRSVERVARWMQRYDRCARATNALLLARATAEERARLGADWFCYEQGGLWHALYGSYDERADRYEVVLHYRQAAAGGADTAGTQFVATAEPADTALVLPLARALHASREHVPQRVEASRARFDRFARRDSTGAVDVWYLPARQANGWLLYGVELRYRFGRDGRDLLDSTVVLAALRGGPPDPSRELTIDDTAHVVPTVGETFFVLAHHADFKRVTVANRDFVTALADAPGDSAWVHTPRERLAPGRD